MKLERVSGDDSDLIDLSYLDHEPNSQIAHPIFDNLPDYLTKEAKKILFKLGDFEYNRDEKKDQIYPFLGPYMFKENNSIYIGQWKDGKRNGRGK